MSCCWWNYMLKIWLYVYFAFSLKMDEIWCYCWWIVVEIMLTVPVVVVICYYWWLEPWVIIIIEIVVKIGLFLRVFTKWVKWWFLLKGCFGSSFIWFWVFLVFINVWTNHGIKFGLRGFKIGILGVKNGFFTTADCHYSPWRVMYSRGELHSDSMLCFAFLRLFHLFIFWIGLWCKHESFR